MSSFIMLRLCRNHSAFNSHNFPRTCTTTYPCALLNTAQLVVLTDSELTSFLPVVLTDWLPSLSTPSALRSLSLPFQLMALHDPFGLLATTLAIVYSVYSAYLPGLHSARPSAFVEGGGVEPPAHPKLFGDSPPRGRTAVAFISVGVRGLNHSPYSNLAGLHHYSGFSFLVLYVAMP